MIAEQVIRLIVIGLSVLNIGTIREDGGIVTRSFWLRNDGQTTVTLVQGYTSCGCTTIDYPHDAVLAPGDSAQVTLHFNPRNKGGEFYENGTVVYTANNEQSMMGNGTGATKQCAAKRYFVNMALEGNCITSDETLLRQHPVVIDDALRISTNRYDLGYMSVGQKRTLSVSAIISDGTSWQRTQFVDVSMTIDATMPKGKQHLTRTFEVDVYGKKREFTVTYDVIIQ